MTYRWLLELESEFLGRWIRVHSSVIEGIAPAIKQMEVEVFMDAAVTAVVGNQVEQFRRRRLNWLG